jgi:hypothetical protein
VVPTAPSGVLAELHAPSPALSTATTAAT